MLFSVIVPFHNEERYIGQCVTSLLEQDFDKNAYELLFVDNASDDRSPQIVRKCQRVKLIHEARLNVYAARNKALSLAKYSGLSALNINTKRKMEQRFSSENHYSMRKRLQSLLVLGCCGTVYRIGSVSGFLRYRLFNRPSGGPLGSGR